MLGLLAAAGAQAQAWPSKPIRIIVPFAPGGGVDILTRAVALELTQRWKPPIVIDNKAGAGSVIGADFVAKAPPDGYTLMATVNQTVVGNRFFYKSLPHDPRQELRADHDDDRQRPDAAAGQRRAAGNNLKQLVALAKKEPGS